MANLVEEVARLRRRLERERNARLQAEAIAERGLRELYQRQEQLRLLERIAATANETASVKDALQFAVTEICQYTGWSVGHAFLAVTESGTTRLQHSTIWHMADSDELADFRRATESTAFDAGLGLPGRVFLTGSASWVNDVTTDDNFPRAQAAARAGLKAACAFPVLAGSQVVAVLEFYAVDTATPDRSLLPIMEQIGTQLGRVIERQNAEQRLIHDATHDPLTGLPNRALFLDQLDRALARKKRHPQYSFAVLFIDLDRFKLVNEGLGHHDGDELIVQVARRLKDSLRHTDFVAHTGIRAEDTGHALARLGGDEFTVLLEDIANPSDAARVALRIQDTLQQPFNLGGQEIYTSASIGIALSAPNHTSSDEIMRDADLAMYRAKALGKARSEIYDQTMHALAVNRLKIEGDLRRALQNSEFVVHYQPIVSLGTGQIVGFEALVRWQQSETELVYPDKFIQIAEETGLIVPIGIWVLREACRSIRRWQQQMPRLVPLTISVNISARQFNQPDLVQQVRDIIRETGIEPGSLRLEVTESVTMDDADQAIRVLSQLKALGVRLAIDDFGTGYSSLSYLQRLPMDILKIDRSFVAGMDQGAENLQIVRTILTLARALGLDVVAEGTETESHVLVLKSLGCQYGQGYYFSRPVPASDVPRLLGLGAAAPADLASDVRAG